MRAFDVWSCNITLPDNAFLVSQFYGDHLPAPTYLFSNDLLRVGDEYVYFLREKYMKRGMRLSGMDLSVKGVIIAPREIRGAIVAKYRKRMNWTWSPPLEFDEPEDYDIIYIQTYHMDVSGNEHPSYIYVIGDTVIISEVYNTFLVDGILYEFDPRHIIAMLQPRGHELVGGIEVNGRKYPFNDINRGAQMLTVLLKKEQEKHYVYHLRSLFDNIQLKWAPKDVLSLDEWNKIYIKKARYYSKK